MTKAALLSASALTLFAWTTPAYAQVTDTDDGFDVITVTAQKREQTLTDVPLSVQALSSESIENAGVQDVAGLVSLIPSASLVSSVSRGFETIQIRGVSAGTTGDGLTGYYVDDFAFGVPNLQLSPPARLLDLEQVEIIRGPSGTIWGQGSMGGNIRLITADPDTETFSGSVVAEYSTTEDGGNNHALEAVLNIPLVEDVFAVRLSGSFDKLSGYADLFPVGGEDVNESQGSNIRIKALFTPTERFKAVATIWTIDNQQDFSNQLIGSNPFTGEAFEEGQVNGSGSVTNGPINGFTDTSMDIYSLALNYDFGGATLTSSTSYTEHELDFEDGLTIVGFNSVNDSTFETTSFTQEIRLASASDSIFNWIVGAYYRDAEIDSDINFFFDLTDLGIGASPLIDLIGPLTTESWSVFGEASVSLFDGKLVPLVGLRYFEDERAGGPALNRTSGIVDPLQEATFTRISPRFNLRYQPTDDATLFVNVAHGFRSGTVQTTDQVGAATALGVPAGISVDPDELWTYELGGKLALAGNSLLLEGSIYLTDWSDVQQPFGPLSSVANVGDAEIRGIDVVAAWQTPLDGLVLRGSANFQETEWTFVEPNITLSLPFVVEGGELLAVPDQTFSVSANYDRVVSLFGGSEISLSTTYAHTGDSLQQTGIRSDELNTLAMTADLRLDNGVSIGLFAFNATDEDGIVQQPVGQGDRFVRPYPRRLGVRVGLDF